MGLDEDQRLVLLHQRFIGDQDGGDGGGRLVAEGTPEEVARNKASYTGQYLKNVLST